MDYTLSTGDVIELRERSTLTERLNRPVEICDARSTRSRQKLLAAGFEPEKPETWQPALCDLDEDDFERLWAYKSAVITAMVLKWPFDKPLTREGAEELSPELFEEISSAALLAYRGEPVEDESDASDPNPNGDVTSDSTDFLKPEAVEN